MNAISNFLTNFLVDKFRLRLFFSSGFILFALIVSTIAFVISYSHEERYLEEQVRNEAFHFIDLKRDSLKYFLDSHINHLSNLADNQIVKNYLEDREEFKIDTTELLRHILLAHDEMMQIRFINSYGQEEIRIERKEFGGTCQVAGDSLLQNKADRYYFKETVKNGIRVWISDIDLNIENGKVEKPFVPTIRVAISLYSESEFKGIFIVNLFMKNMLEEMLASKIFNVSLIDGDGYVLVGRDEVDRSVIDLSWSKYRAEKIKYNQQYLNSILKSYSFSGERLFSKNISKDLELQQELFLVAKIQEKKINELRDNSIDGILYSLKWMLILTIPVAFILSIFPSLLAEKVIATRKELDEKNLVFSEYLETMDVNNIISKSDLKGRITYINDNFSKVSGYSREEVIGKPHSLLRHPDTPKETFEMLWLTIQSGNMWSGILKNRKKDGGSYDVNIVIKPIKDSSGKIFEYLAIRHEITEFIDQKQQLVFVINRDPLTGKGNRYKLSDDINKHILNNLAVIDIDKFSMKNDFFGHRVGDEIIRGFAEIIDDYLDESFFIYRLHGDKFAVLNYTLDNKSFEDIINKLNEKIDQSVIHTTVKDFSVTSTAGISFQGNRKILATAELVNRYAKTVGKKSVIYSKDLNIEEKFKENIKWTDKIKKALSEDRFAVFFQPILNNISGKIEKYEALVRMEDSDGTIISPFKFLGIAKSSGQYIAITKFVMREAFKHFKYKDFEFSINLTIEDILNEEIKLYLEELLEESEIAHRVVLEIVETEEIEQFGEVQKFIKTMKRYGCKVAIDDFGTGYSNFDYLIRLDVDYVKIDGSMIKKINEDNNIREIVLTIVSFAKKMGYKTIAEFVSSEDILQTVQEIGIEYSQGYYIGEPKPIGD
jgi:PAS domain S-box-containing protein/diguanylate cyclase (GGDEF)-like protein